MSDERVDAAMAGRLLALARAELAASRAECKELAERLESSYQDSRKLRQHVGNGINSIEKVTGRCGLLLVDKEALNAELAAAREEITILHLNCEKLTGDLLAAQNDAASIDADRERLKELERKKDKVWQDALNRKFSECGAFQAECDDEKKHRVYYQDIVYSVCNTIDHWRRAILGKGSVVCGTVVEPSDETQRGVNAMQAECERLKEGCRRAKKDRDEWHGKWTEEQTKRVNLQSFFDRDGVALVQLAIKYDLLIEERNALQAVAEAARKLRETPPNDIMAVDIADEAVRDALDALDALSITP